MSYSDPTGYSTMRPGRGGTILALGVTGLVLALLASPGFCCCPLLLISPIALIVSVLGIIFGWADLRAMNAGQMDPTERGNTTIGFYLSIAGAVVALLTFIGIIIIIAVSGFQELQNVDWQSLK